ncbi:MAG: hypothetical protein JW861_06000 [Bacteroidales bacterium]|nr:hypothetical protein [Bacteroidales bacterium]
MQRTLLFAIVTVVFYMPDANPAVIRIPDDYPSIQQAINAASMHDTVLVSPGYYMENIHFRGKNIVVASHYLLDPDPFFVEATIISGGYPSHPDTASCVLIVNGEDSTAVLMGFTLQDGLGTKWLDEHGAGLFREGGGILIQNASPAIRNNKIWQNQIMDFTGCVSSGGGAIRAGDSNPLIMNNVIMNNKARYGAGIVLNYSGAVIRNNLIAYNHGGEDYGGGGIWSLGNGEKPVIIVNNHIVYNHSELGGGGIRLWQSTATVMNNIIWGNSATTWPQIQGFNGMVTYCNVEGGWQGEGNIDEDPLFDPNSFNLMWLGNISPCIDAGNPDGQWNDPEDPQHHGQALFPAKGGLRNDMGAYGGPGSILLTYTVTGATEERLPRTPDIHVFPNPCTGILCTSLRKPYCGEIRAWVHDTQGHALPQGCIHPQVDDVLIDLSPLDPGCYLVTLKGCEFSRTFRIIKL